MGAFQIENGILLSYEGKDEIIEIPDGVKVIGEEAFYACNNLKIINLPDGVCIKDYAFFECTNLESISDKGKVVLLEIGKGAFNYCEKLETEITIDKDVKEINEEAFYECKSLKKINLPDGICIKDFVFFECINLESISSEGKISLSGVGESAFAFCEKLATDIWIEEQVKFIGDFAFENCVKLKNVYIPKQTKYSDNVFLDCKYLENEDNVSSDEGGVEVEQDLESVQEQESPFVIENHILKEYCGKASVVYVPEEVTTIGERAFAWNQNIVFVYFKGEIKKIGKGAFLQCENLKGIYLPHNIIIGEHAFENCFSLEKINNEQKYVLGETGEGAFSFCENLSNDIEIAEGSVEVKDSTFAGCLNIKKMYIPDSLKQIGKFCFGDVEEFVCENNAEMYICLQDQGFECVITGKDGKKKVEEIEADTVRCFSCGKRTGRWEKKCIHCGEDNPFYIDDKELKKFEKMLRKNAGRQLPEWKSIFPEKPYTVEEQWLYGIHPDDETYKKLLELEVIRKFSGRWKK